MKPIQEQSLILRVTGLFILPLLILFSLFLLLRGHNEPGGGFIAGLVAASAVALYLFFTSTHAARRMIAVDPRDLIGWGLLVAIVSGLPPLLAGQPFMEARWAELTVPFFGLLKAGTPLLFDLGVYMVVTGTVLAVLFSLAEDEAQ